jgi:Fur family iron response transcriptional regulator
MTQSAQERSNDWLVGAGVRPTRQRLALAELLIGDGEHRHVCAESLYAAAAKSEGAVSLATVYNTLKIFCDAGLMSEITVDGHKSYFDTRTDQHPHYYWENDGALTDAPKSAVKFVEMPTAPEGTEVSRIDVVIRLRSKS